MKAWIILFTLILNIMCLKVHSQNPSWLGGCVLSSGYYDEVYYNHPDCMALGQQQGELVNKFYAQYNQDPETRKLGVLSYSEEFNKRYGSQLEPLGKQICACIEKYKSTPSVTQPNKSGYGPSQVGGNSNAFQNNNNLHFPGTPEQQAALQRQLINQNIGSAMNTLQQGFAKGSQQTLDQFANQTAGNQGKVDAINNQGNSNQPRDDKGIMDAARSNNQSTDNLGPGQETDDANATPNYSTGPSRLAESERDIQRQRAANTSDTTPVDANPSDDSVQKTLMDNVKNFVDGIKEKGLNWANFTDEEKAKVAYLGYTALSASQSVIGGLLFTLNPIGSGFLLGTGAFSKALYDQVEITNPFLRDWSKK